MRTIATPESRPHPRIAPSCCMFLLVAAFAVIVFDLTAIYRGIDADAAMVDQHMPIQEAPSGASGFESSKGSLWNASESGLSISDSEDFGIRKALNAELLKDSVNQPVLDDWLLIEPDIRPGGSDSARCSSHAC
jgi:hypothetical protein